VEDSGITSVWVRELICEFVQTINYDVLDSKIPQVGPDSSLTYMQEWMHKCPMNSTPKGREIQRSSRTS
jgi:hypothetical protein